MLTTLILSTLSMTALAASINCTKASTNIEKRICSSEPTIDYDNQLNAIYVKLLRSKHIDQAALQKSQQQWLKTRNACADVDCLNDQYAFRLGDLTEMLRAANGYQPDMIDQQALAELTRAIKKQLKTEPEFPLEAALKTFEVKATTSFYNNDEADLNNEGIARFPIKQPLGVSVDEWQALQKSNIDAGGEHGMATYTLLDINNDGQRDLIVDSYMGGTGLFNWVSTLERKGNQFIGNYTCLQREQCSEEEDNTLYSLGGRGGNQEATWVRLQGRIYAAYRESMYGVDHIALLRPFKTNVNSPTVSIYYQYALSIPKQQETNEVKFTLDDKTLAALKKGLTLINPPIAQDNNSSSQLKGCPVPKELVDKSERWLYSHYGPGHYSFEIVGDFPVWLDSTCYIARLANWFGSYSKKFGLHAMLFIKIPNDVNEEEQTFDITGRRTVTNIESSYTNARRNN